MFKKLLILLLALSFAPMALAGSVQDMHKSVIAARNAAAVTTDFVFTVRTTGAEETFTIPCQNYGTFNAVVDWGDGSATSEITTYNDADLAHEYATADDYEIRISGTFPNIFFNNNNSVLVPVLIKIF